MANEEGWGPWNAPRKTWESFLEGVEITGKLDGSKPPLDPELEKRRAAFRGHSHIFLSLLPPLIR